MALIERKESPERVRGVERSVEVQLGRLGGFEVRPTRLFLWPGEAREGRERLVSFGSAPRNLKIARTRRELRAGAVEVRSLGNPLMTIALAGVHAVRRLRDEKRPG